MIFTSRPTRSPSWSQPLFKVIWRGFIVWPRWLTHTFTSFFPALTTFSTFLTSDKFLVVFFFPCGSQPVAGFVLQLRKAVQSPKWFSTFTEWCTLIGLNSEPECFAQLHRDTEWHRTWAGVNVMASAWIFLRCNRRFKFQEWQISRCKWPSILMKLYINTDWTLLEIYVINFNLQPYQVSNSRQKWLIEKSRNSLSWLFKKKLK